MSYSSDKDIDLQNVADEVKVLTKVNSHTDAYIAVCEVLELDEFVKELKEIHKRHIQAGSICKTDYDRRYKIYSDMNESGRELLGEEVYNKYFYNNL